MTCLFRLRAVREDGSYFLVKRFVLPLPLKEITSALSGAEIQLTRFHIHISAPLNVHFALIQEVTSKDLNGLNLNGMVFA